MIISIDNTEVEVTQGERLIDVCDRASIAIPRFCYHKELSIAANCRMCLVEVEGNPKLQPSCTMTVSEGMSIHTTNDKVRDAQQSVMELLLINHPLDCPICDQGGECELQDVAINYGSNKTFFHESKRVVNDKDIGNFIQTDLTRCIHCMRCVRFGTEVAGITELGATGRGEHMKISAFLESTIDSEISGNMIDICPVGALTSKPYRYSTRSWQMTNHEGVARHDCLGSNLHIQTFNNKVYRVSSRENADINGSWISDRDRFSYLSLTHEARILQPKIKIEGEFVEASWETALEFATKGLKNHVMINNKGYSLGVLADPTATFEELYLLKHLAHALGSEHTESIMSKGAKYSYLASTTSTRDITSFKDIIILGGNIERDEPIITTRVKKAKDTGARVRILCEKDGTYAYANEAHVVTKGNYQNTLEALALDAENTLIICTDEIHMCSDIVALNTFLSESFTNILNVSIRGNIGSILATGFSAPALGNELPNIDTYILHNITQENLNEEFKNSLTEASFVISLDTFSGNEEYADVILPLAGLYETAGTHININNDVQTTLGAVTPSHEVKEGWKILKVLIDALEIDIFALTSFSDVSAQLNQYKLYPEQSLYFATDTAPLTQAPKHIDVFTRHTDILMQRIANSTLITQNTYVE